MLRTNWYDKIAASQEEAAAVAEAAGGNDDLMEDIAIADEIAATNLPTEVKAEIMDQAGVDPEIIQEVIDADTSEAMASYYGIDPYWLHDQRTAVKMAAAQSPWLADKLAAGEAEAAKAAQGIMSKIWGGIKGAPGKVWSGVKATPGALKDAYTAKAMRQAITGMGGWKQAFGKGNRLAAVKAILKNSWQPGLAYGVPLAAGGAALAYGLSDDGITASPYFAPTVGGLAGAGLGAGIGYALDGGRGAALGALGGGAAGAGAGYYGGNYFA